MEKEEILTDKKDFLSQKEIPTDKKDSKWFL